MQAVVFHPWAVAVARVEAVGELAELRPLRVTVGDDGGAGGGVEPAVEYGEGAGELRRCGRGGVHAREEQRGLGPGHAVGRLREEHALAGRVLRERRVLPERGSADIGAR